MSTPKQNGWTWSCNETLPSEFQASAAIVQRITQQLAQHGWSDAETFRVRLAVEEAVVNAIKHGNQMDRQKQVQVLCSLSPQRFFLQVTDEGQGFEPATVPDPCAPENLDRPSGRGLLLMRSFMTRVEYHKPGNRVSLELLRGPEATLPLDDWSSVG